MSNERVLAVLELLARDNWRRWAPSEQVTQARQAQWRRFGESHRARQPSQWARADVWLAEAEDARRERLRRVPA